MNHSTYERRYKNLQICHWKTTHITYPANLYYDMRMGSRSWQHKGDNEKSAQNDENMFQIGEKGNQRY